MKLTYIFAANFVALTTFVLLTLPFAAKAILSVSMGVIAYLFIYVTLEERSFGKLPQLQFFISEKACFMLILGSIGGYIFTLLFPYTQNLVWSSWNSINIMSWVNAATSILLLYFLPGYMIVRTLFLEKNLNIFELLLFSFALSLFSTGLMGYILFLLKIGFSNSPVFILVANSFLLLLYMLRVLGAKKKGHRGIKYKLPSISKKGLLLLVSLVIFVTLSVLVIQLSLTPFVRGDAWRLVGRSLLFSRDVSNVSDSNYVQYSLRYPYWVTFGLAFSFKVATFPCVNFTIIIISILSALFPFAFYLFAWKLLKNPRLTIIATTFFTLFSGFGWYFLVNEKLNTGIIFNYPLDLPSDPESLQSLWCMLMNMGNTTMRDFIYPLARLWEPGRTWVWSFFCFILLIYLLLKDENSSRFNGSLSSILLATCFLSHLEEALYFLIIVFPVYILVGDKKRVSKARTFILYYFVGIVVAILLDTFLPAHSYLGIYGSYSTLAGLTASLLFSIVIYYLKNVFGECTFLRTWTKKKVVLLLSSTMVAYFYGLAIITFTIYGVNNWESAIDAYYVFGGYPWYYVPLGLGVYSLGVPSAIYSLYYGRNNKHVLRNLIYPSMILLSALVFGDLVSYVNQFITFTGIYEIRVLHSIFGVAMAPLAAYAVCSIVNSILIASKKTSNKSRISSYAHESGKILVVFLLAGIVITGSLSTLFTIETWVIRQGPLGEVETLDENDISAVDFLLSNSDVTIRANAPSDLSSQIVQLSGLEIVTSYMTEAPYPSIFGPNNPETIFLLSSDVGYLYLASRDVSFFDSNSKKPVFFDILNYFPVTYKNPDVTMYFLPFMTPPSNSSIVFVRPLKYYDSSLLPLLALTSTGGAYDIGKVGDANLLADKSIVILPSDLPKTSDFMKIEFKESSSECYELETYNSRILSFSPLTIQSNECMPTEHRDLVMYFKTNVNLTEYRYVLVEWMSEHADLCFYPRGSREYPASKTGYVHTILGTSKEWQTTLIDLHNAHDFVAKKVANMSGDSLVYLKFRIFASNVNYSISRITLIKDASSYYGIHTEHAYKGITDFLKAGGTVIVFNGYSQGVFSEILNVTRGNGILTNGIKGPYSNINFSSTVFAPLIQMNSDRHTEILANYTMDGITQTPWVIEYHIDKGKILYINIPNLGNLKNEVKYEILNSTVNLLKHAMSAYIEKNTNVSRYPMNMRWISTMALNGINNIVFTGKVSVIPESIDLNSLNSVKVTSISIENSTNILNIKNAVVNIEGEFDSFISAEKSIVNVKCGEGVYVPIILSNATIKITPGNQTLMVKIFSHAFNETYEAKNCLVNLQVEESEVLCKRPLIENLGQTHFSMVEIRDPSVRKRGLDIDGKVVLHLYICDNNNFFATEFIYDGKIETENYKWTEWNEWQIPWREILTSRYHLIYIGLLLSLTFVIAVKPRLKVHMKKKIERVPI